MPESLPPLEAVAPAESTPRMRVHGSAEGRTLVYLPGLHGDWTLVGGFRDAVAGAARFVEFTYPRTLTWTLEDYGRGVDAALAQAGVRSGWLLAESFGSQVAWALMGLDGRQFDVQGLVLAGGFVRHPMPCVAGWCGRALSRTPLRVLRGSLRGYAVYSRFRRGTAPARRAELEEFIARRTQLDLEAAVHRLRLIQTSDPGPIAAATQQPVFYLTGLIDPVVPWSPVRRWLQRHCPGFRGWRLVAGSDHNVLSSVAPAADQVLAWMNTTQSA